MKIAYLITSDISRYRGSTLKVKNQVDKWKDLGHHVEVFARVPDFEPPLLEAHRFRKPGSFVKGILTKDISFIKAVENYKPDILYIRQSFPNFTYFKLQRKYPNVIEIVNDDIDEYVYFFKTKKDISSLVKILASFMLRDKFYKLSQGLISGTKELAGKKRFSKFKKSIKVVPNSITMKSDTVDILKDDTSIDANDIIHLFFIGSPGFTWHGTDKLEKLSEILGPLYFFHIVGLEGKDKENLKYYGYLSEEEYDTILSKCHICISTFALHRKNQNECTTIKFCEYLKKGFPVIVPYKETTILVNGCPSWVLELPNTEDVIELPRVVKKIETFCYKNRNTVLLHKDTKKYVDSNYIEKDRIDFIQALLFGSPD